MNAPVTALARSDSKARFMARLGLIAGDPDHEALYAKMKVRWRSSQVATITTNAYQQEVTDERQSMLTNPDVLIADLRSNPSVRPPYSTAQISETEFHRAALRVYRRASPETRRLYDLGHDTTGIEEENWIITWLLWHVIRYRDHRRKKRPNGAKTLAPRHLQSETSDWSLDRYADMSSDSTDMSQTCHRPVRESSTSSPDSCSTITPARRDFTSNRPVSTGAQRSARPRARHIQPPVNPVAQKTFYDPVRDL